MLVAAVLVGPLLLGCGPDSSSYTAKPATLPVGNDELVVIRTTATNKTYYWIAGLIPFPQQSSTTVYDVRYRIKKGVFGKRDIRIQTSPADTRPPGIPPASHNFIAFIESPPYGAIDLYVASDALTKEQYLVLAKTIQANLHRSQEIFGQPVASIRHSVWKWDS